jgi:hypothetical protein
MKPLLFIAAALCSGLLCFKKANAQVQPTKKLLDSSYYYDYFGGINSVLRSYYFHDNLGRVNQQITKLGTELDFGNPERMTFIFKVQDSSYKTADTTLVEQWNSNAALYVNKYRYSVWQSVDTQITIDQREEWNTGTATWDGGVKTITTKTILDTTVYYEAQQLVWNSANTIWDTIPGKGILIKWNGITLYSNAGANEEWWFPNDSSVLVSKAWDNDSLKFVNSMMQITVKKSATESMRYVYLASPLTHQWEPTFASQYKTVLTYENGRLKISTVFTWDNVGNAWIKTEEENRGYDFEGDLMEASRIRYIETGTEPVYRLLNFYKGGVKNAVSEVSQSLRNCAIPNPLNARTVFDGSCFDAHKQYSITITDIAGRTVATQFIRKGEQFKLGQLDSRQLYFISIANERNQVVLTDKIMFAE